MKDHLIDVIFICTGNSCRSPLAEGILKKYLPEKYRPLVHVHSAGTLNYPGMPISTNSLLVAREQGIDLEGYQSVPVNKSILENTDYVFCMAEDHLSYLNEMYPSLRNKYFLLKTYGEKGTAKEKSIKDPIGESIDVYRLRFLEIEKEIQRILPILLKDFDKKLLKVF